MIANIGDQVYFYTDDEVREGKVTEIIRARTPYFVIKDRGDKCQVSSLLAFKTKEECKKALINNLYHRRLDLLQEKADIEAQIEKVRKS